MHYIIHHICAAGIIYTRDYFGMGKIQEESLLQPVTAENKGQN